MSRMKSNHDMFQKMGNPWVTEKDRKRDYPRKPMIYLSRVNGEVIEIVAELGRKRRYKPDMPSEPRVVLERLPNNVSVRAVMRRAMMAKKVVVK